MQRYYAENSTFQLSALTGKLTMMVATIRLFVVLSLTFFSVLFAVQEASALSRLAKVTIIVTDEAGLPIEGALA